MDELPAAPADARAVDAEIREQLLEPIIAATHAALGEMAGTELAVRGVYCQTLTHALGEIAAVLAIKSQPNRLLVLSFTRTTAVALTRLIMMGVTQTIDEELMRDCVGEIANVIGGQATALLAESPFPYSFAMPPTVTSAQEFRPQPGHQALVVVFRGAEGDFAMQFFADWR